MHEKNACKTENKRKRKGIMDILAYGEKKFAKIQEENDKKLLWSLAESKRERERGKFENFLKKMF